MTTFQSSLASRTGVAGWRDTTRAERVVLLVVLVLVALLVVLGALDTALRAVAVVALFGYIEMLWLVRVRVHRRQQQEQVLAGQAARGVRQIERWLATGPRA